MLERSAKAGDELTITGPAAHADDILLTPVWISQDHAFALADGTVVKVLNLRRKAVRLGIGHMNGYRVRLSKPPNMKTGLTYVAKMDKI